MINRSGFGIFIFSVFNGSVIDISSFRDLSSGSSGSSLIDSTELIGSSEYSDSTELIGSSEYSDSTESSGRLFTVADSSIFCLEIG